MLKWIGRPDPESTPTQLTHATAKATLEAFRDVWEPSEQSSKIRADLAQKIGNVARLGEWQPGDMPLLAKHYQNLNAVGANSAAVVKKAMTKKQWLRSLV